MMRPGPLRVLHVLEATLGGTRRYLDDLAVATTGASIEQGLVYGTSRADSGFADVLARLGHGGWGLFPVEELRRPVHALLDWRSVAAVRKAIRQFNPMLVHAHSAKGGAVARLAALSLGRGAPRVVYSPHALPSRVGRSYMLVERALARATRRFIAVSDSERTQIVAEGVSGVERVDVVYPRIDVAQFAPRDKHDARAALQLGNVPIVIGIGRLAAQKDPLAFVETLAQLRLRCKDAIGIWVGDGELRQAAQASARALGLGEAFTIAGWVTDVRPYIAACDVLLSTARYESFGYVVPETLAMDRPVVAARVTGIVDVLDGSRNETLYELDNTADAVQLLQRIIVDPQFAAAQASIGRESVVERFSTQAMQAALITSYRRALD